MESPAKNEGHDASFDSFLTEQIIAYIGNKRKLLGLIYRAMEKSGVDIKPGLRFFDVFAGGGVVSRFAKSMNFQVFSNDWEYYSRIINSAYLCTDRRDIKKIFGSKENYEKLILKINSLPNPLDDEQYIAKYYAPKSDDINNVDYKSERLFYTRQNALNIDKIRNFIEENYPEKSKSKRNQQIRNLLIAQLIYEAATHTNTSGVFKACHKEFGGHGKDALKRILAPIELHESVLIDSDYECQVFQEDANSLAEKIHDIDVAYLDPPYNQHQYGSNYHMLNTIAKWDRLPVSDEKNRRGVLKEKAGIRHDWIETRSPYCYKNEAEKAFEDLIKKLDARYILISYSTDGIIPFESMKRICMEKGRTTIVTNEYTTYRGGKQSNSRKNTNIEFILCVDTKSKSNKKDLDEIESIVAKKKLLLTFKQKFAKQKFSDRGFIENGKLVLKIGEKKFPIETKNFFALELDEKYFSLPIHEMKELCSALDSCACETKEEELNQLILTFKENSESRLVKMIPRTLKKLASKKNRAIFEKKLEEIWELKKIDPEIFSLIENKIREVEAQAKVRFET